MRKMCFIRNCLPTSDGEEQKCFFNVPEGKLEEWQKILAHKPGLTKRSRLCNRHFREEDIKKGYIILGKFHPNKVWRLKKDVVPSLRLGSNTGNENVRGLLKPIQKCIQNDNKIPTVKSVLKKLEAEKRKSAQPRILLQKPLTTNDDVQQNVTGAINTSNLPQQEAQSKTSHSNVLTIQAPHIQQHDYAEVARQNNQIQTAQIDNLSQLETTTLPSPEEQQEQSTNVTREDVPLPDIQTDEHNLIEEDVIILASPDEHLERSPSVKGARKPKPKQALPQLTPLAPRIKIPLSESFLFRLKNECDLPPGWVWIIDLEKMSALCSIFINKGESMIIKIVEIVSENEISFILNGNRIQPSDLPLHIENSLELLKAVIFQFDKLVICNGVVGDESMFSMAKQCNAAQTSNNEIRAKSCLRVSKNGVCKICYKLLHYLKQRMKTSVPAKPRNSNIMQSLKRSNLRLTRKRQEALDLVEKLKTEILELKRKARKESLEYNLSILPPTAQTVVRMFIRKASLSEKDVKGKSMKWDSEYLVQCAMLRKKSSIAYRYIKENGLLPLPSEETLRKIVNSSECNINLNEVAPCNIGEELEVLPEHEIFVNLVME